MTNGLDSLEIGLVNLAVDGDAVTRAESVLTADELARARRAVPAVHRRRVLLRAALRQALASQLGMDPAAVPLTTSPTGRPEVPGVWDIDVSCSSSSSLGIVVVSRHHRIGVDLELVREWTPDVLSEGWLAPAERAALMELPLDLRGMAATRAWTRKEAVLKGRGCGLLSDPRDVVVRITAATGTVAGWELRNVSVPDGWVASLAIAPLGGLPR